MSFFSPSYFGICLVGRTNTGKSTLFNRLIGKSHAIESPEFHMTRDIRVHRGGRQREYADFPGLDLRWFTKGSPHRELAKQLTHAAGEAQLVLWLIDFKEGYTAEDRNIFRWMSRSQKPWIGVINKVDSGLLPEGWRESQGLPAGFYVGVSASHKTGLGVLEEAISERQREVSLGPSEEGGAKTQWVVCVGRANAGKSSFCNQALGHYRVRVAEEPHTTRDMIELPWEVLTDRPLKLIDTAGLLMAAPERISREKTVSVLQTKRAIEKSHIAFFFLDATVGFREVDKKIYHLVRTHYTTVIVIVNKWDCQDRKWASQGEARKELKEWFDFPHHVMFHSTGGKFPGGVFARLLDSVLRERERVIDTSRMNGWVEALRQSPSYEALSRHWAIKYAVQKGQDPIRVYCFGRFRAELSSRTLSKIKKMLLTSFVMHFDIRYGPVFFSLRRS
jgi:GTP-binding protein